VCFLANRLAAALRESEPVYLLASIRMYNRLARWQLGAAQLGSGWVGFLRSIRARKLQVLAAAAFLR